MNWSAGSASVPFNWLKPAGALIPCSRTSRTMRIFTAPSLTYESPEVFMSKIGKAIQGRYVDTKTSIDKLRARGGKIVFVRFPMTGDLKKLEDQQTPRARTWDPLLKQTNSPGIYFEDY